MNVILNVISSVRISKTQNYGHKLDSLGLLGCVAYENALSFHQGQVHPLS